MILIDAGLQKYKPSVRAAGLIFAAISCSLNAMIHDRSVNLESLKGRQMLDSVAAATREWRYGVLEHTFEMPDIYKIAVFSELLLNRMTELHKEFKQSLRSIFPEEISSALNPKTSAAAQRDELSSQGSVDSRR